MSMPNPVFEDGLHLVRSATAKDTHKMRWVVKSVAEASKKIYRHCPTEADAIRKAKEYTKRALKDTPEDAALIEAFKEAATIQAKEEEVKQATRLEREARPPFATTHFVCRDANPTAQVWQCTSLVGERGPIGRKTGVGKQPKQSPFRHDKGEFAVMCWKEPVRDPDGQVRVFRTFTEAQHFALDLHFATPEDERIGWQEGDFDVYHTEHMTVQFNPNSDTTAEPFMIWVPRYGKYVKAEGRKKHYVTQPKNADGSVYRAGSREEQAAIDFNTKVQRLAYDEVSLTDDDKKFRTIWSAADYAIMLEKVSFGSNLEYTY